jgi:hydroxymethylglutaryl-CoA lyase
MRGLEDARAAGVRDIAIFAAASETFSRKNINASIDDSLGRYKEVCDAARTYSMTIRGYISCVLWCPYEGRIESAAVARVAQRLLALGCNEISLGETIGKGTPGEVQRLIDALVQSIPRDKLAVHFHDTYGQALANVFAALEKGIAVIDSSVAGLGGCPYAPGAAGNVPTEDVLYMLNGLGISTGVDLGKLAETGRFISSHLGRPPSSRANLALSRA